MTEKVVLTKEQAEAIERWADKEQLIIAKVVGLLEHGLDEPLYTLTTKELIQALYIGYEVEPEFEVGDWVVHDDRHIAKITKVKDKIIYIDRRNSSGSYINTVSMFYRHATPEEIAEEKERRLFAEHGRKKWELKRGDILIDEGGHTRIVRGTTDAHGYLDENKVHFVDGDWEIFEDVKKIYKVACFAENRLDVNNND